MSDEATSATPPGNRLAAIVPALKAWVGSLAVSRKDLTGDAVAGVPGAVGSVPDGMAASVLVGVNPDARTLRELRRADLRRPDLEHPPHGDHDD